VQTKDRESTEIVEVEQNDKLVQEDISELKTIDEHQVDKNTANSQLKSDTLKPERPSLPKPRLLAKPSKRVTEDRKSEELAELEIQNLDIEIPSKPSEMDENFNVQLTSEVKEEQIDSSSKDEVETKENLQLM